MFSMTLRRRRMLVSPRILAALVVSLALVAGLIGAAYVMQTHSSTTIHQSPVSQSGSDLAPAGGLINQAAPVQPDANQAIQDPGTPMTGPSKATKNGNQGNDKSCSGNVECGPGNPAVNAVP
jgi:hypothetical protein